METLKESRANVVKLERAEAMLRSLLDEVLRRGYHGLATLELVISDGTIQRICRRAEQIEK